jgi:hypothetical protein
MLIMNAMFSASKARLLVPAVCGLVLAAALAGCEGEKNDPTGADAYFKNNPYSSEDRPDTLLPTLDITPSLATLSIIGQEIIFTASGGDGIFHWSISNDNGEINSQGANQCSYKCRKVGNNDVIVQDESGHYASAHITPTIDKMTVTPSSVSLSAGARYVAFTVSGGTPPYAWTSGNPSLGTISYSSATSYTAGYTAVAGAAGQNTITVLDAEGRVATASVTQSQ